MNDPKIADTTSLLYPYPEESAGEWIKLHAPLRADNKEYIFTVFLKAEKRLIGTATLLNILKQNN